MGNRRGSQVKKKGHIDETPLRLCCDSLHIPQVPLYEQRRNFTLQNQVMGRRAPVDTHGPDVAPGTRGLESSA